MKLRKVLLRVGLVALGMLVLGFGLLLAYVLYTQHRYATMPDTHDLLATVDKIGTEYVGSRPNAGLVIGVIQKGQTEIRGFGLVNGTGSGIPNGRTLFELGSITKVLTGVLLGRMVAEGQVGLDEPITKYLPADVTLPAHDGPPITLKHLATHAAGFPRLPADLDASITNEDNPYANYDSAALYRSLRTLKLNHAPGKKSEYSNFGVGLLGHLLELKAGRPYEELVLQKVCLPLGMTNTVIHLNPQQKLRQTPGHKPGGKVTSNWDFQALAGCGAFSSCAEDLLRFLRANIEEAPPELAPALKAACQTQFASGSDKVGLCWQISDTLEGQAIHWHDGGTGGYVSFIGFDQAHQIGVVLLSNYGDVWGGDDVTDDLGMELLRLGSKISLK